MILDDLAEYRRKYGLSSKVFDLSYDFRRKEKIQKPLLTSNVEN